MFKESVARAVHYKPRGTRVHGRRWGSGGEAPSSSLDTFRVFQLEGLNTVMTVKSNKRVICPRSGFIILTKGYREFVMTTSCKTWSCEICRKRNLAYVKLRMEYGCSALGEFYLITVTLQADSAHGRDARAVRTVWEQLIRFLKLKSPQLTWMKIVELTKQGTPHLHLLVGGLGKRKDSCARKGEFKHSVKNTFRACAEDCLIHEWSQAWFGVTGDSWVVDARKGSTPARLANYLGKYLTKSYYHRKDLEEMGFKRRWSCARNWPSPTKMETITAQEGGWDKTEMIKGYGNEMLRRRVEADKDSIALEQVGDLVAINLMNKNRKRAALAAVERQISGSQDI